MDDPIDNDDLIADCEDRAEELRLKRLGLLLNDDGNTPFDESEEE